MTKKVKTEDSQKKRNPSVQSSSYVEAKEKSLKTLYERLAESDLKGPKGIHLYWSQKSVGIAEEIYKIFCEPNQIIFDPFMGVASSR